MEASNNSRFNQPPLALRSSASRSSNLSNQLPPVPPFSVSSRSQYRRHRACQQRRPSPPQIPSHPLCSLPRSAPLPLSLLWGNQMVLHRSRRLLALLVVASLRRLRDQAPHRSSLRHQTRRARRRCKQSKRIRLGVATPLGLSLRPHRLSQRCPRWLTSSAVAAQIHSSHKRQALLHSRLVRMRSLHSNSSKASKVNNSQPLNLRVLCPAWRPPLRLVMELAMQMVRRLHSHHKVRHRRRPASLTLSSPLSQ